MFAELTELFLAFPDAVVSGTVIAAVCAVIGVFVILKRVVFIGMTLSEVAACGIAVAMVAGFHPFFGATGLTLAAVIALAQPYESNRIPRDAVLGLMFVLAGASSVLIVSKSGFGLHEVKMLLYGDLILTSRQDMALVLLVLLPVGIILLLFLRPLVYAFLDRDAAKLMGIPVRSCELGYFVALALAVATASKTAGAVLVFCYLTVCPATGLLLSRHLWAVIGLAIGSAVVSTITGMAISFLTDSPTNQCVAVTACAFCLLAGLFRMGQKRLLKRQLSYANTLNQSA